MRRSVKISGIAGVFCFVLSIIFSLSLLLVFFDFGTQSGNRSFVYYTGKVLVGAYGFTSLLIPLFLLIAAISCFLSSWSIKHGVILLGSFIPFFSIDVLEHVFRLIVSAGRDPFFAVKLGVTAGIGLLVLLVEYLVLSVLGDILTHHAAAAEEAEAISPDAAETPDLDQELVSEEQPVSAPAENSHSYNEAAVPALPVEEPEEVAPVAEEAVEPAESAEPVEPTGSELPAPPAAVTASTQSFDSDFFDIDLNAEDEDEQEEHDESEPGAEFEINDDVETDDDAEMDDAPFFFMEEPEPVSLPPVVQPVPVEPAEPAAVKKIQSGTYEIPAEGLLDTYADDKYWIIDAQTEKAAAELKNTLNEFRIEAEVTGIRKGPVVTMFEILPAPGVKLSKIVALQDNIALRLAASSVRIVAPIPGRHAVGIEVPNKNRSIVSFKEIIEKDLPEYKKMAIPVILGKDISGDPQLLDLAKTPHLLIAGSTGSGKSVCVNSMILSILYKRSPQEVKLLLIDPKIVELKLYNDIPHLLTPVITEPKKAMQSLQYCLCEMERRYAMLDGMGVRDILSYNRRIVERKVCQEKLPYIVVIIDEFADLMATTGKELESTVARLAAMSRAVGIHLVLATQRPSIDVITGLIKANIPSRIAFMVASKMDSRIIIDQVGAEKLLGKGDMLYSSATDPFPIRIQGTFISDNEVENVVDYVKQFGAPEYIDDEIFVDDDEFDDANPGLFSDGEDPLYDQALQIVVQAGKASASYIQRRLKIGYNRAARLVEDMESRGIVGPQNGSKPREIIHLP
jgi:DNA segregation ATPase FtsK/SpoIIIE, S-DNA-T family